MGASNPTIPEKEELHSTGISSQAQHICDFVQQQQKSI
jgi:hypothetical protein